MFIYAWNTVDYNSPNYIESFKPLFYYLETLKMHVFLLGGNHDKERLLNLNYEFNKNIIFVKYTFIRAKHQHPNGDKYTGIMMGHDLGNNFEVLYDEAPSLIK